MMMRGEIGEVDDIDSLVMDFHNANENNIAKNDMFSPSTKNPKSLTLTTHFQRRRDETTQRTMTVCCADPSLIYPKFY